MTVPTVVGSALVRPTSNNTGTLTLPGGSAVGDLLIVAEAATASASCADNSPTLLQIDGVTVEPSSLDAIRTWQLTLTSTGTITLAGDAVNFNGIDYVAVIVHHGSGTPTVHKHGITNHFVGTGLPGSTSHNFGAVTTTVADCLVLNLGFLLGAPTITSIPSGDTQDQNTTATSNAVQGIYAGHFSQSTAGTTPTKTLSTSDTGSFQTFLSTTIAVAPPTAPAAPAAPVAEAVSMGVHATIVAPDNGGSPITSYSWQYSINGGTYTPWGSTTSIPEVVIHGVFAIGDAAAVEAAATNSVGTSSYSPASGSVTIVDRSGRLLLENGAVFRLENGASLRLDTP